MSIRLASIQISVLVGVLSFTFLTAESNAQVLIYKTDFTKSGNSINFDFFDQGFFIVDALGGRGSFILTYQEGGRDFYVRANDAGELFFAVRGGNSKAVIRATSNNETGLSHYLAIGDLKSSITISNRGQKVTLRVAPVLRGTVLASDSESDVQTLQNDDTLGFAGSASFKATLQRFKTRDANKLNQSVSQAAETLINSLERQGVDEASEASATDSNDSNSAG